MAKGTFLILVTLLRIVSGADDVSHVSCKGNNTASGVLPPRVLSMVRLLSDYRHNHGIEAIQQQVKARDFKAVCARKWIRNSQFGLGCNLVGNHFGSAASTFLAAVVLDRTLLLIGDADIGTSCEGSVYHKTWTVTQSRLEPLLIEAGCNFFRKNDDYKNALNFVITHPETAKKGKSATRTCGYARSPHPHLIYDDIFNSGVEAFATNKFLSPSAKQRAAVLFSNPIPGLARFESYGFLLRALFGYTNQTISMARAALTGVHDQDGTQHVQECLGTSTLRLRHDSFFTVGVHLRHKSTDEHLIKLYDDAAEKGISLILDKHGHKHGSTAAQKCVLLVASDRAETIVHMEAYAVKVNCIVRYIRRDLNATVTEQQKKDGYEETGPWSAASIAMADLFLLTHSQYFLGSADSTFSFLIGDDVAAHAVLHPAFNTQEQGGVGPLLWVNPVNSRLPADTPLHLTWAWASQTFSASGPYVVEQFYYKLQQSTKDCPFPPSGDH